MKCSAGFYKVIQGVAPVAMYPHYEVNCKSNIWVIMQTVPS